MKFRQIDIMMYYIMNFLYYIIVIDKYILHIFAWKYVKAVSLMGDVRALGIFCHGEMEPISLFCVPLLNSELWFFAGDGHKDDSSRFCKCQKSNAASNEIVAYVLLIFAANRAG